MMNQTLLSRTIAAALFTAVAAGTWDSWWHGALGRETFWSPPHLLLYASVLIAIGLGVYGWYRTRERLWKRLALFLVLVPISAPFDELWHRIFGIETPASPVIIWSPPHVVLIAAIGGALLMLLPVLRNDRDRDARRLFSSLTFVSVWALLMFLATLVQPAGPYELLGFWGAGILAAILSGILLAARAWIPGIGSATTTAMFYVVLVAMNLGERLAPGVSVPPHDHAPPWLIVFSILVPALSVDLLPRLDNWMRGAIAGFLWSVTLYGMAWAFFEPQFQYSFAEGLTGVAAAVAGGFFAGLVVKNKSPSGPSFQTQVANTHQRART